MAYKYFSDEEHLKEWMTVDKNPDEFKEFLQHNIFDCTDHEEYINRNGGSKKMRDLRAKEMLLFKEGQA